ncbi:MULTISPECIES: hypothetical protein [Streptomyces]|jgi:hypothetical protein|uniref:Secreted protein n=2 Tax=Streptomyces bottropensis TaxID=42235 RepID=M3EN89_9ACTN|nr:MULTISPECIES: hypothetical protein [Streptomyces]EMF50493.1 hypothetical protein SBD_8057 [Streptomyces bottropensis ATCC 25435]MZD22930.1 hypothetical protein [Streptomyces sp. SID5476]
MAIALPFRRKAVLAALVITAAAATTVTLPGTAAAQSGSRICGNYWEARANGKTVGIMAKVLEVPKVDFGICLRVIDKTNSINGRELPGYGKVTWNPRQPMRSWTCEDAGDLFNDKYGEDPCLTMNRVDLIGQVANRTPVEWSQVY